MIGLFLKKAFYDGWDNLLQILVLNACMLALGFGVFFLAEAVLAFLPLSMLVFAAGSALEGVILLAISAVMAKAADCRSWTFRELVGAARETWMHGALFGLIVFLGLALCALVIPWYLGLGNGTGMVLAILMFWVAVVGVLSLQWFLPIRSQLETGFVKCLKKSFIIFLDNPGFSVFMLFYSLALGALSVVCVLLVPGAAGLTLAHNEAFRLRLRKYDWLETLNLTSAADIAAARKTVPWDELLAEDRETTGHRSLKSFIFPWKD